MISGAVAFESIRYHVIGLVGAGAAPSPSTPNFTVPAPTLLLAVAFRVMQVVSVVLEEGQGIMA